ncbi:unnamed protein product [Cladocopium goreaui]|uniref:Uncharacterized protein R132 n=1 Tax=Cladocopium goreaui TaxID=2562237 RepID=A0A9P1GC74_9DINO|nr:unnamed protein product [Cladocopium goreaui]
MRALKALAWAILQLTEALQPLPSLQEDFFDLLLSQYPFPLPSWNLDRVAGRLSPACKSVQDLLALAIASSQLHSFNVRSDGSYDLSLPAFDQQLPGEEVQLLLQTCEGLAVHYANLASKLLFLQLLCPAGPTGPAGAGTCMDDGDHDPLGREGSFCQGVGLPREEPFEAGLGISEVHFRATARMERLLSTFCHRVGNNWGDLQMLADRAAEEVRSFLDHAFQSLSVMQGLPAIPPLDEFLLSAGAPVFYHAPIAGERWHVLQHILSTFSSADRARGLRVAEVGVEKGMTITYLMKHEKAIAEYVAVDPWHIPGKSEESNAILAAYHENLQAWSREEEAFQRHGQSAVRIIRKASEEAAGLVETDYFDLVFIDADHTFEAARRDIQVWRRRVRPNGGVMAGHDFSLFHPAVSLAVVVECSATSSDAERLRHQIEETTRRCQRMLMERDDAREQLLVRQREATPARHLNRSLSASFLDSPYKMSIQDARELDAEALDLRQRCRDLERLCSRRTLWMHSLLERGQEVGAFSILRILCLWPLETRMLPRPRLVSGGGKPESA